MIAAENILTERLQLLPATIPLVEADLAGTAALGAALGATVPDTWPPEFYDEDAARWTLNKLRETPMPPGWWGYYIVRRAAAGEPSLLIGTAGYKGPPAGGMVEIGYGIVRDQYRKRYATEVAAALVARAFRYDAVDMVMAETLPELVGSIGVLDKCGFSYVGDGSEPGVIRYELLRSEWLEANDEGSTRAP